MIKNFLFHRVNPQRDALWDPMDVHLFDRCIKYLSKNYELVLLEDIVLNPGDFKPGKNYATIVFDDGYKDNIEYALPVLEKYNVKASFYVVTDCIQNNMPTWTHILDHSFQFTSKSTLNLDFDFLSSDLKVDLLNSRTERIAYVRKLKPALKKITHAQRIQVLNHVQECFDDVILPELMMNWDEVRQLKNAGHYIGSHTANHFMLGTMENENDIWSELFNSGDKIQKELGYFPSTISYPVGSYNQTTIDLSKKAGYKIGLAVKQRAYNPDNDNCFEIPRIELYNESWLKTMLRIKQVVSTLSNLIKKS